MKDPATAAGLSPRAYPLGCKRPVMDTRYFETFNRANVRLVDLRDGPIERITATGVQTKGEGLVELDALVYATGFDAMTGGLLKMDIRGRGGARLADAWRDGPKTFLGLQVHGFPNLFTITGPGSPSVISNMMVSIEQHVDYVADMLAHMRRRDARRVEADAAAQEAWVKKVNDVADGTMYTAVGGTGAACAVYRYIVSTSSVVSCCVLVGGVCITCVILLSPAHRSRCCSLFGAQPSCNSWYLGANIEGKTRVFMPFVGGVRGAMCVPSRLQHAALPAACCLLPAACCLLLPRVCARTKKHPHASYTLHGAPEHGSAKRLLLLRPYHAPRHLPAPGPGRRLP